MSELILTCPQNMYRIHSLISAIMRAPTGAVSTYFQL